MADKRRNFIGALSVLLVCGLTAQAAEAQGAFDAVIQVNDRSVTRHELEQRQLFLSVLGASTNPASDARRSLINDRLRLQAAEAQGITLTEDVVQGAMADFAARSNLALEEFQQLLSDEGIDPRTLRDFVQPQVLWLEVVGARFSGRAQVSEAEIDRAITQASSRGGVRALMSEIVLPMVPETLAAENMALAKELSETMTGTAEFEQAARRMSASPTRSEGGRLDWLSLSDLPPEISTMVLGLRPGEVSPPIPTGQAVILFQLRALAETPPGEPAVAALDYVTLRLPGATATRRSAEIRARAGNCNDLYGLARDLPEAALVRSALEPAQVPDDIRIELARLDDGEVSTALRRGQDTLLVMLCGRSTVANDELPREQVRQQLRTARLEQLAESYLAQLRADAVIVEQ
ncbi:MAG: peptidylprolyl isomerase [Pseudomonadota bacterium]